MFGVVQFVGGLLAGPLTDAYSGELLMLLSFGASAMCYLLTASATTMWMLYLSRVPTLLQHGVLAARAIVTERTNESDRARMIGYVGLAYGVGFLIGPGLGGVVSKSHLQATAWLASLGSLLSMALIVAFLPLRGRATPALTECGKLSTPPNSPSATPPATPRNSRFNPREMWRVCFIKGVPSLLAVKILSGTGAGLFHAIFALVAADRFQLAPDTTGLVMSYIGGLTMISQAVLIEWATSRYSDTRIIQSCTAVLLVGFVVLAGAQTTLHLCITMLPIVPAGCLLSTVNTAQLTKAAPKDPGTIIAIDMSVGSAVHIVTPAMSTYILTAFGFPFVMFSSAGFFGLLYAFIHVGLIVT
eukprot:CAMPEP_0196588044 /NCGR_PEP_ID=MMETSP1081-20130531/59395_1 /TAXON_ID=36882 /ORGANISM="Pyramimonas amylifera, Strain CCMP720" /LENGTH=357 /DNA_ID=CAMNT_0041910425 /DNA_START=331 /DNA_END=1404 /DNA_ORIENTATION=-